MTRITLAAREFARSRETAPEVAQAILDLAHDHEFIARRIWSNPTRAEREAVECRAWAYAAADVQELAWGHCVVVRGEMVA